MTKVIHPPVLKNFVLNAENQEVLPSLSSQYLFNELYSTCAWYSSPIFITYNTKILYLKFSIIKKQTLTISGSYKLSSVSSSGNNSPLKWSKWCLRSSSSRSDELNDWKEKNKNIKNFRIVFYFFIVWCIIDYWWCIFTI
jgi:hypothetical protein